MESASEPPLNKEFEKLVHETLARWHVPGVSVAVIDGDKSWAEGYGIATFPSTPATASTLYCVGSTTKAFTAAAASLLIDQGKLSWHTRLSDVIGDDFILPGECETTHITLEDALSHRTGMPGHDLSYGNEGGRSAKEVTRSLRYLPCTAPLRTKWIYSNIMYVAAAHAIETVSGSTISDLFKAQIMNPLGMQSTYFTIPAAREAKDHFAQGYYYDDDVGEYQEVRLPVGNITLGAGGLISNVLDFAKWVRTMIKELGPMTKEGHKQIRTPRMLKPPPVEPFPFTDATSYCLGWETAVYRGVQIYMHAGEVEAYGAYVAWIPCLEFGVVAFANTAVTSNFVQQVLIWTLIDNKMKTPIEERFDWNKRNTIFSRRLFGDYDRALQRHFPCLPPSRISPSLPLASYLGSYKHPAYGDITITLKDDNLYILRAGFRWEVDIVLEHVNGEHFLGRMNSIVNRGGYFFKDAFPSEFRIDGANCAPAAFGARLEEEMGEEKIWFDRCS